jgi:hypothetical protein
MLDGIPHQYGRPSYMIHSRQLHRRRRSARSMGDSLTEIEASPLPKPDRVLEKRAEVT